MSSPSARRARRAPPPGLIRACTLGLGLLALGVGACSTGSRERACDLVTGTGCGGAQQCAVDAEGVPRCVTPTGEARGEGQACQALDQCAEGLGCVRVAGVPRCARFCRSADRPDPCVDVGPGNGSASFPDADEALRDEARCVAVLPDRDDLGICVLPCRLGVPGDCPAGATCGVPNGLPAPTCIPAGSVPAQGGCGAAGGQCAADLVCADPGGFGRVCLAPAGAGEAPCVAPEQALAVAGAGVAVGGEAPRVCSPCLGVGAFGPRSLRFGRCEGAGLRVPPLLPTACALDEAGLPGEACPCGAFGEPADLAGLSVRTARDLGRALQGLPGGEEGDAPQVAAARAATGWFWASGAPVAAESWAPDQPAEGDCAGLTAAGLISRACAADGRTLCQAPP